MTVSVQTILDLFDQRGDSEYGGEAVTQMQHALQCAVLAQQEDAPDALVAAALLHDVGHLIHDLPDDAPEQGIDDVHERSAARFLEGVFPPDVTEPVRMHVAAKRYLCATDAGYFEKLSEPSVVSLELQGGPMSDEEVAAFESSPHAQAAVRLRKWDDLAKDPEMKTPPISAYADLLGRVVL